MHVCVLICVYVCVCFHYRDESCKADELQHQTSYTKHKHAEGDKSPSNAFFLILLLSTN